MRDTPPRDARRVRSTTFLPKGERAHPSLLPRQETPPPNVFPSPSSFRTSLVHLSPQIQHTNTRISQTEPGTQQRLRPVSPAPRLSAETPPRTASMAVSVVDPPGTHQPPPDPPGNESQHHALEDSLLQHFMDSDQSCASTPEPCTCHKRPLGSCPTIKNQYVTTMVYLRSLPGLPANMDGARIPLPRPSFPIERWKIALKGYFDAGEILSAMQFGWDFSFLEPPTPKDAPKNLASASIKPGDIDIYIDAELRHASLIGPFKPGELPLRVFHSPLGSVDKDPVRRTITDCSQCGDGINAFISAHEHRSKKWKLFLPTTKTIVGLIKRCRERYPGLQVQMFKLDFSRWYRWFQLDPGQACFFAVKWNHLTYIDAAMSFGNRAASLCAQRVMWSIVWLFRTRVDPQPGIQNSGILCSCPDHCEHGDICACGYVDDTITVAPEPYAQHQYQAFIDLCSKLGLRLSTSPGHLSPPSSQCVALGLLYNLDDNTVSLPPKKLEALLALLDEWLARKFATDRQFASLCGKLLNAANVIQSGRLLTCRILRCKRLAAQLDRAVLIDSACRADLIWWKDALRLRNGVNFLEHDTDLTLAMDASSNGWMGGLPGLAGFNFKTGEYFHGPPPPRFIHLDIANLEALCHVLATKLWASEWKKLRILGQTDNTICFWLFQNGRSDDDFRLHVARYVAFAQVEHEFVWEPEWISTQVNTIPDALSRWGDPKYHNVFTTECDRLGITPVRRHLLPEHFDFGYHPDS